MQVGTLTRYLLDEVSKYEHGYSDMLMPSRSYERHVTFMGGNHSECSSSTAPLSAQAGSEHDMELRGMISSLQQQQQQLEHMLAYLTAQVVATDQRE